MTNFDISSATNPTPRGRGIAVAFTVIGLVVAASGVAVSAASAARISDKQSDILTASVDGIDRIELENSSATLTVVFDDVDEASLDVRSTRSAGVSSWSVREHNGTLVVDQDNGWFAGGPFIGFWGEETATLTLPAELNGTLDLDLTTNAGVVAVAGDFHMVTMQVNAGDVEIDGAVEVIDLALTAGAARLATRDVTTLDIEVTAGSVRGSVSGAAPADSRFSVTAGDIALTLPDEEYRVNREVVMGDAEIDLNTNPDSSRNVTVKVTAGDITLRRE